jgi:hypothetical protein
MSVSTAHPRLGGVGGRLVGLDWTESPDRRFELLDPALELDVGRAAAAAIAEEEMVSA